MPTVRCLIVSCVSVLVVACSGGDGGSAPSSSSGGSSAGASGAGGAIASAGSAGSASGAASGQAGNGVGGQPSSGAGGVGGSAGNGGVGGASPEPVLPILRDGKWAFELGEVTLELDPRVGGRITGFSYGDQNLLTGPDVNPTYWGSTLWTSPEAQWMQPPPGPIDSDPYAAQAMGATLVLSGQPYDLLNVSVIKTFSVNVGRGAFEIEYTLTNTGQSSIQMAAWEVTRVFPKGLTFFATGSKQTLSSGATLPTTNTDGVTWFSYDQQAVTKDSKLYADAAEGWVAHAVDGLVFIKSFPDVPAAMIAPNEGDVELYVNAPAMPEQRYIELEDQAAYGSIAAGAAVTWKVSWFLRQLPPGLDGSAPSAALAQFVRDTIQ